MPPEGANGFSTVSEDHGSTSAFASTSQDDGSSSVEGVGYSKNASSLVGARDAILPRQIDPGNFPNGMPILATLRCFPPDHSKGITLFNDTFYHLAMKAPNGFLRNKWNPYINNNVEVGSLQILPSISWHQLPLNVFGESGLVFINKDPGPSPSPRKPSYLEYALVDALLEINCGSRVLGFMGVGEVNYLPEKDGKRSYKYTARVFYGRLQAIEGTMSEAKFMSAFDEKFLGIDRVVS